MQQQNLIPELRKRGLIQDIIPGTEEQLTKEMTAGYVGFDPTADSLHIGSMLPIILLMRYQRAGHQPFALVGGATGMIGDPTGKSAERNLLNFDMLQHNLNGIRGQLEKFLDFDPKLPNGAKLVNNYDWLKDYSFLDFIRDIGKHISVNYMMAKDSVQKRLEFGLSFTEFSYQLIQGYDFYYLNKNHNVKLQFGGADQWGNITTGTELVRRMGGGDAFAFTCPLLKKADGGKMGKTESGSVWLDKTKTSPYKFYQYWVNVDDADVANLLRIYTFLQVEEIDALLAEHAQNPKALKKILADEITTLVHGADEVTFAQQATQILFSKNVIEQLEQLTENQFAEIMEGVPTFNYAKSTLDSGIEIVDFLVEKGILPSKGEARKLIQNNGISINKQKVQLDTKVTTEQLIRNKYILVQKGKSNNYLAVFE